MRSCFAVPYALLEEHIPRLRDEFLAFATRRVSERAESVGHAYAPSVEIKPRREAHERHVLGTQT